MARDPLRAVSHVANLSLRFFPLDSLQLRNSGVRRRQSHRFVSPKGLSEVRNFLQEYVSVGLQERLEAVIRSFHSHDSDGVQVEGKVLHDEEFGPLNIERKIVDDGRRMKHREDFFEGNRVTLFRPSTFSTEAFLFGLVERLFDASKLSSGTELEVNQLCPIPRRRIVRSPGLQRAFALVDLPTQHATKRVLTYTTRYRRPDNVTVTMTEAIPVLGVRFDTYAW